MKIALCAARFVNGDAPGNVECMISHVKKYRAEADMICFGEAFLQGFDGLTWDYDADVHIAVAQDSPEIARLRFAAQDAGTALAFGYMELAGGKIYSSYMVIAADGAVLCNYRRMSVGWKVPGVAGRYAEGDSCTTFELDGKRLSVMLCGDLWTDEVAAGLRDIDADTVLWPVYTDFDSDVWNTTEKLEYAARVNEYCRRALLVNCVCDGDGRAKGGAAMFEKGCITAEVPAGGESVLVVEV